MPSIGVVFIFIGLFFSSESTNTICDSACVCRLEQDSNRDFLLIHADCSYIGLSIDYGLPASIHTLDLSSNGMSKITESQLFTSQTMEVLRLNKNNITSIEIDALNLPQLTELDLSDNRLEVLDPEIFKRTKKLEYLNLASNKLVHLPHMMFHHLSELNKLVLDFNNVGQSLNDVDLFQRGGLALNNAIKSISLRGVNFNKLPENFFLDAYDLREITISDNNLTSIPDVPFTLEYLDISDNPIGEIFPEDFSALPALKTLKLNNLLIKEIPEYVFASLKTLRVLEMERNKNLARFNILAFGDEVLDDPTYFTLESLSLRGSRLSSLSQELETPLGQLTSLDLQGNPWKCDCKLVWLKEMQLTPDEYEHLR